MFKVTLAQINPTIGDIQGNVALMKDAALKAQEDGANLVVFPELSLTAYYPADLLDERDFLARIDAGVEMLKSASKEIYSVHWVVGVPTKNTSGFGKPLYNSLLVIKNGEVLATYHKQLLPTYNIFDERRHFEPGPDTVCIVRVDDLRVGFMICEDGWNDEDGPLREYKVNPFARLAEAQPDFVVSINASPAHIGKREVRHGVFARACARHRLPLVYVNQIGGHDQLVYDGGSFAVNETGTMVFEAKRFVDEITTLVFDRQDRAFLSNSGFPLEEVKPEGIDKLEFQRQAIVLGTKDYARRCGFKKAVVGCSGGIDSALTLALAVEALGAEHVMAITMPSDFSSEGSVTDSVTLCQNLNIPLREVPIAQMVNAFRESYKSGIGTEIEGLALENLQARVRGTLLMAYSNSEGNLLLTTGNKSEVSVGYATLYGDTNGGLGLIGDLYKTEVFALCRHLNETAGFELIPSEIIEKPPSAELAPGQKDTDSLPPYDVLDEILKVLIEGDRLGTEEATQARASYDMHNGTAEGKTLIMRIKGLIARSEYKRRQAAPIVRVRGRSFGNGRQMPIAAVH